MRRKSKNDVRRVPGYIECAEANLEYMELINRNAPLTRILRGDIDDLKSDLAKHPRGGGFKRKKRVNSKRKFKEK